MPGANFLLIGALTTWLTPLWLLSVGVAGGVVILAAGYGILRLVSPRAAREVADSIRESLLLPVLYLALFMTVVAVVGTVAVPARSLLATVSRIPAVGVKEVEFVIPPASLEHRIPIDFTPAEVKSFELVSDQPITVYTKMTTPAGTNDAAKLKPDAPYTWSRQSTDDRNQKKLPRAWPEWTVQNTTSQPAHLKIRSVTDIAFPEVRVVPLAALSVVGLFAVYLALRFLFPKVAAIALTTSKDSASQPLFYVTMAIGAFAMLAFVYIPYNTFGEDVKVLKDQGLTLIMVIGIIVAVWSASISVSEEIEGRTALTLLSKPVHRRQFIFGKFFGILEPVLLMFIMLGFLMMVAVSYKMVYDAREVARAEPTWQACYLEVVRTVPGLVLAFMETVVLAAISVAISTRMPMLANIIICFSIYVLGHLVPVLVNSSVKSFPLVHFVGQFFATILPVLEHFNIQAAVAAGAEVPLSYLGMAGVYCLLYSSIAMLLALAMFEDRDLA